LQNGFDTLDLGLRALDRGIGLIALRDRAGNVGFGALVITAPLVECLLRDDLFADEFCPRSKSDLAAASTALRWSISDSASAIVSLARWTFDCAACSCASYSGDDT
jgi:hypothetical protein